MDAIAQMIADFHKQTNIADSAMEYGNSEMVHQPVEENFTQIKEHLDTNSYAENLATLDRWSSSEFVKLKSTVNHRYTAQLKSVGYMTNPGAADWESPQSKIVRKSITAVTGEAPTAYPNHYAGDIRYPIRLLGVPAYGIGSLGGNFYMPDEWIDIDDLVELEAVLVDTLSGWQND